MSELRFGYYDCIITPSADLGLAGYEKRNGHGFGNSGVMDDLYARALCLKSGNETLILITVDLCILNEKAADHIREKVAAKLDIPVDHVMLNVSHTHSGPQTAANPANKDSDASKRISSYMETLSDRIVAICSQASCLEYKGRLYTATYSSRLAYNRRYITEGEEGKKKVKMLFTLWRNPGHDTNGVVDTDIPVLVIERVDENWYESCLTQAGTDRVVLFNVPVHPVILGEDSRYVSADYPGAARRCIEHAMGSGTKAMFLLGACGNVNPLLACQNSPKAVDIYGNALGYGICAALAVRREVEFDGLKAISESIKLKEGAHTSRVVSQVFKIGKAAIAAVSCECFTELGIRIRKESGFDQTLVATNSNGGSGYIPTRETWETEGGYEMDSAERAGFDKDFLDRLADKTVKNLHLLAQP